MASSQKDATGAIAHVVVSEGLAYTCVNGEQQCGLSDYFEAVLERVAQQVPQAGTVYLSPANAFGCECTEEEYAAQYLQKHRPDLQIGLPVGVRDRPYLDTFDNARVLRKWLQLEGRWPLGPVILYCNRPHAVRSRILFRLCGYSLRQVVGTRPAQVTRTMTPRLWFYDHPPVQWVYEALGLLYGLTRWWLWILSGGSRA